MGRSRGRKNCNQNILCEKKSIFSKRKKCEAFKDPLPSSFNILVEHPLGSSH